MSIAANKAVALGFLAAIEAGDIARCEALLDPAARWCVQGHGSFAAADFLASLAQTIARAATRTIAIGLVTAEDDRVAVQAEGDFAFAEGAYRNSYHYLFRIAGGRIVAGYEYLDTMVAARFFGSG
jgi:ketosteroid isomerase-like protein